jgi:hypothetical protein
MMLMDSIAMECVAVQQHSIVAMSAEAMVLLVLQPALTLTAQDSVMGI